MPKKKYGFTNKDVHQVTGAETLKLGDQDAIIVDLRKDYLYCYKAFDKIRVINIPLNDLNRNHKDLPKDQYLILADTSGNKSRKAYSFLAGKGFNKLAVLAGGFVEWERDGLPIKTNVKQRLSGSCMCQLKPRENKK